jgi:hypothetical protein
MNCFRDGEQQPILPVLSNSFGIVTEVAEAARSITMNTSSRNASQEKKHHTLLPQANVIDEEA